MFYLTPCDFMCDAFFEKLNSQANAQIKHSGDFEHAEHMCRNNHLKFDAIGIFDALGTSATAWRLDFANICFCLAAGDSCSTRFGTFKQSNKYTNLTLAGDFEPTENCVTQQLDTRCDGNTRERLVRLWIIGFGKAFVQNTARMHTLYHRSSVALLVPFVASVGSSHTPRTTRDTRFQNFGNAPRYQNYMVYTGLATKYSNRISRTIHNSRCKTQRISPFTIHKKRISGAADRVVVLRQHRFTAAQDVVVACTKRRVSDSGMSSNCFLPLARSLYSW